MNFSEFKKLIGADPRNRDTGTLRARNSAPEFEAAAAEAEAFEEKLQSALFIQPPDDLLGSIKAISQQPVKRRNWIPLALAASLLITVGAVTIVWKQSYQWESVEAYVVDHYSHDGSKLVAQATDVVAQKDIDRIMAKLGATADEQFSGRIKFIKYCPTPEGRGAHMVVSTDQGPMTIIFMPETQVADGEMLEFDQMHAMLVNLEHGSVAIIGEQGQAVESLQAMVRESLKTGLVGV
ncbi:MAG: DUF3379 domain-containing protein [Gammaproteobacteria bacterium]|nr:DUF3379 domain-containing protein [Gammaproteobacteria bacterium]